MPEVVVVGAAFLEAIVGLPVTPAMQAAVFAGLPLLQASKASPERQAEILRDVESIIAKRDFRVIGEGDDQAVWQKGWGEVAVELKRAGGASLDALKPQYFHRGVELRLAGAYWSPQTDYFEYWLGIAVRRLVMLHALAGCERLVELGCGTGMNLITAALACDHIVEHRPDRPAQGMT